MPEPPVAPDLQLASALGCTNQWNFSAFVARAVCCRRTTPQIEVILHYFVYKCDDWNTKFSDLRHNYNDPFGYFLIASLQSAIFFQASDSVIIRRLRCRGLCNLVVQTGMYRANPDPHAQPRRHRREHSTHTGCPTLTAMKPRPPCPIRTSNPANPTRA